MRRLLLPAILILATGWALLTAGCAVHRPAPPPYRPKPTPPEPAPIPKNVPRPELLLVPGDLIRISVHQQPDLDLETRIPDNGSISYPLIGPVQASGR